MHTKRIASKFTGLLAAGLLAFGAGACGSNSPLPIAGEPRLIPGGGIGDGPIRGKLNVYVIDEDTRNVLSSASVRVGAADELAPCMALTDSTGLARFDSSAGTAGTSDGGASGGAGCGLLTKAVTLTVSASGHAPSTWIGVDGSNVTIALRAISAPALGRATVMGTIAGWDDMPAPAPDHNRLAFIGASSNPDLTDRANNLDQGTRRVVADVLGQPYMFDIASNICVRNANVAALVNDCDWVLTTHSGPQAHFAILLDQDTKGTEDESDDTTTVTGWAIKTGLTFGDGTTTGGESLPVIPEADMMTFSASFAGGPSGLDYAVAYPVLDLGSDGRITIVLPTLSSTTKMTRVPKLTGPLAGGHYDMLASAIDDPTKPLPATVTWLRNVDPSATVAVSSWMAPPSAIAMTAGTFSFTPVAGATLHGAELQTMDGQRRWSITIFDGSTSFTLPGLSPDPLPLGTIRFSVSALKIPGVDLKNVVFADLTDLVTDISTDEITYSR
jgi:hypothetical protein